MGRYISDHSESPVRDRRSPPRRRSPDRREKSPARHRSSHSSRSSTREKTSSRAKSPRLTREPVRASSKSPGTWSPSPRTGKLRRPQADSDGDKLREQGREKNHVRTRSPISADSKSPETRSPSPRSKRLKRASADTRSERTSERGRERTNGKDGDRTTHKERDLDRELPKERRERRAGRDAEDNASSRSKHPQTTSSGHHNSRHRSRSPSSSARGRVHDEIHDSRGSDRGHADDDPVAQMKAAEEALETKEKQKPSFELSGKLAAETNRVKGVTLLFTEPPDARKPDIRWRLYVFKGGEVLNEPLYVHRQTCYLFGRERRVADIPTDHPSCSKQHAVLQYRQVEKEQADGTTLKQVRPYIMDLGSTNGTFINDSRIEPQRYYELIEKDTLKFGNSSREYVLLHENSAG